MRKKLLYLCVNALLSAVSTSAWALSEVNGVYQIGTAADWEEFAALVNGGEVNACAVLTADIDTGVGGTMIGVSDKQGERYDGTFDGQGHSIKINMHPEANDAGLFRYIGWRAVIQNLKVEGTITTASKFAGGIVGRGRGIVRNCWANVTINSSVSGDATHGGIVAVGNSGTIVENCLVLTAIVGETTQNCGGVVGWAENPVNIVNCLVISDNSAFDLTTGLSRNIARNDGKVKAVDVKTYNQDIYANRPTGACYNNYVTNQWGTNEATTVVPFEDLADGRICYQLNNDQSRIAWVQTIGIDPYPVPAAFGSRHVYASAPTACDGKSTDSEVVLTFSNSGSIQAAKHTFDKYGICSKCGCFNFHYFEFDNLAKFDKTDRAVLLSTKEDIDVAEGMNRICNGFKLNMKMANDIEYIAEPGKYIFNPSDWIDGNFNGQGHVFTIGMSDMGEKAALFPEMAGNVENLIIHGTIQTNAQRTGSVSGNARMDLVRNVYSDVNITSSVVGDNTSGGFFGWTGDVEKTVENCIYAGTFTLPGSKGGAHCARIGGFAGWSATKTNYTNCALLGNIIGAGNQTYDDDTENSQNIARNPGNVIAKNVYVVNPIFGNAVSDHDKYIHYENEEGIANGELAFFLNGKQNGLERFYQLIGIDPEPMPIAKEGALVYSVVANYRCDGTLIGSYVAYSNSPTGDAVIPPHQYEDGFCIVCGAADPDAVEQNADGFYLIGTAKQLNWFAKKVEEGSTDIKALLTADIDLTTSETPDLMIGGEEAKYAGTFDGGGHTITYHYEGGCLAYKWCGLFRTVEDGTIRNLRVEGEAFPTNIHFGALIGVARGTVLVENVVTNVDITGVRSGVTGDAGMLGANYAQITFNNCATLGEMGYDGSSMYSSYCGWSDDISSTTLNNCYTACELKEATDTNNCFTLTHEGGSVQINNCYYLNEIGMKQGTKNTLEQFQNGEVCYKLNGDQTDIVWYQRLGTDDYPIPYYIEGGHVYKTKGGDYTNIDPESIQTLTLTASGNGAISYGNTSVRSSSQSFDVVELSEVVLTITPDAGHHVETLTINGEDALTQLTSDGKLSIGSITSSVTVAVTFAANVTVAKPIITPNGGTFTEPQTVTLSAEAGCTIFYTTDGTEPTKGSTQYTVPFTVSENCTVKAIAYEVTGEHSAIASAEFKFAETYTSIAALCAAASAEGVETVVVEFNNWIVTGVKGNNVYFTDGRNGICLYQSGHNFEVGDKLTGTATFNLTTYNECPEITGLTSTTAGVNVEKNATATPQVIGITDLANDMQGCLITLKGVTFDGSMFVDEDDNTITPYGAFITLPTLMEGKTYDATGVAIWFSKNGVWEIAPRTADEFELVTIQINPELVTPPENGKVEYYTLTGKNSKDGNATRQVKVVWDDEDEDVVYISGLSYYMPKSYVMGIFNNEGDKVTFKAGQYMGNVGADLYFGGYGDGSGLVDVVADYNETEGVFTFSDYLLDNSDPKEIGSYAYWEPGVTVTLLEGDPEIPVEIPKDLEIEMYSYTAYNYFEDNAEVSGNLYIGIHGDEVYIQGMSTDYPEAWIKGRFEDETTVVFPSGQLLTDERDIYFIAINDNYDVVDEYTLIYDPKTGVFEEGPQAPMINSYKDKLEQSVWQFYLGYVIKPITINPTTQTLTLTASGNGIISYGNTSVRSSSQSFDVVELSEVVLIITPDAGHHVETLTINGEDALSQLTDGKLSIGSMTSSVTVAVTFANYSDLNADGNVDVADIMFIINLIATDTYYAPADLNKDEFVDVGDIMAVINVLIGGYYNSAGVKAMSGLNDTEPIKENNDYLTIANEDNIVSIQLDNEFGYSAFQMLVTLPDGVDIDAVTFNSDRLDGFTKFVKKVNEGQYIIIGFSMDGNVITGSTGKMISLSTTGNAEDNIIISEPIFSIPEAKPYKLRVADSYTTNLQDVQLSQISVRGNTLYVYANSDTTLNIYTISGALCEQKRLHSGVNAITLRRGQYIINNQKVTISK